MAKMTGTELQPWRHSTSVKLSESGVTTHCLGHHPPVRKPYGEPLAPEVEQICYGTLNPKHSPLTLLSGEPGLPA